jgi:hypothetical protein
MLKQNLPFKIYATFILKISKQNDNMVSYAYLHIAIIWGLFKDRALSLVCYKF